MKPLVIGDYVFIQNQAGNYKKHWDKRGRVVKVNGFDQYTIKVDGSRRLTKRNLKFLRKFNPYIPPGWAQQAYEAGLPNSPLASTPATGPSATPPPMGPVSPPEVRQAAEPPSVHNAHAFQQLPVAPADEDHLTLTYDLLTLTYNHMTLTYDHMTLT